MIDRHLRGTTDLPQGLPLARFPGLFGRKILVNQIELVRGIDRNLPIQFSWGICPLNQGSVLKKID